VALSWFPKLREASLEEREKWMLSDGGDVVIWPSLGLSTRPVNCWWGRHRTQ
jgi:hypothetical protein